MLFCLLNCCIHTYMYFILFTAELRREDWSYRSWNLWCWWYLLIWWSEEEDWRLHQTGKIWDSWYHMWQHSCQQVLDSTIYIDSPRPPPPPPKHSLGCFIYLWLSSGYEWTLAYYGVLEILKWLCLLIVNWAIYLNLHSSGFVVAKLL